MNSRSWMLRRQILILGVLLALLLVSVLILHSEVGTDLISILAALGTIASSIVVASQLLPRQDSYGAARRLAKKVLEERERALRQALADSGDPRPANLGFRSPSTDTPELLGWRDDGGASVGTLHEIAAYYSQLVRGRLVILGEPGAGKTVAASQLVVDLARAAVVGFEGNPSLRRLVPVMLNLAGWIPSTDVTAASGDQLAHDLDKWIVDQLVWVFGIPRRQARTLVTEQWILPVLDGLDELDHYGLPPRDMAFAVVRALNARGRRPVVLVCRRADYISLAAGDQDWPGEPPILQDAQHVILQDLTYSQIRGYLAYRFPYRGSRWDIQHRWQPVLRALARKRSPLLRALRRPWYLFLAVSAYQDQDTDPAELLKFSPEDLSGYLLAKLIPAKARRYAKLGSRSDYYNPQEVLAWLTALARQSRGSAVGLNPYELWRMVAGRTPNFIIGALTIPLAIIISFVVVPKFFGDSISMYIAFSYATCQLMLAPFRSVEDKSLRRLDFRGLRTAAGCWRLVRSLLLGIMVILALEAVGRAILSESLFGFGFWYLSVTMVVIASGLTAIDKELDAVDRPSGLLRQSLAYDLTLGFVAAISVGVVGAEISSSLAVGIMSGGLFAISFRKDNFIWLRYYIGTLFASRQGAIPSRPALFLDWAYSAGLLRLSGIAIQFRHSTLQEWLEQHYDPTVAKLLLVRD